MRKQIEVEFSHEGKTYIATGCVDVSDKEMIGTTFGAETEMLTYRVINSIEMVSLDMVDHGEWESMMDNKMIKEIAIEAITEEAISI